MRVKIEDLLGSHFMDRIGVMVEVTFIEVGRDRVDCKLKPTHGSMYEYSFKIVDDGTIVELNGASDFVKAILSRRSAVVTVL